MTHNFLLIKIYILIIFFEIATYWLISGKYFLEYFSKIIFVCLFWCCCKNLNSIFFLLNYNQYSLFSNNKNIENLFCMTSWHIVYFVSPRERPWRQRVFWSKTLVIARSTCVFSHAFKKEHRDWRIKDASCSVYPWALSVKSWPFSGWDKV